MTRALLLLAALTLGACGGPRTDPACVAHCEVENDRCMTSAANDVAIQGCDHRMTTCLAYCR